MLATCPTRAGDYSAEVPSEEHAWIAASPVPAARAAAQRSSVSLGQSVGDLKRIFASLDRELIGFGPLVIQAMLALLTRENLLLFSPPGTAKTLFAGLLFGRISGARVFDTQMSKGTLAEDLFGSVNIREMKRGRMVHTTRDTLVDADLAFVDEFFDANDMVLRALLGIFHERVFKKGSQRETARLHTGIAAANYLRATDVTEAVLDRFLFRAYIAPDYTPTSLLAIDRAFARHYGRPPAAGERFPLHQLTVLADVVRGEIPGQAVSAAPHVLFLKNVLLNRYRELLATAAGPGKRPNYLSPRTYAKARLVLNAAAILHGRMHVTTADLALLQYMATTVGGTDDQAACFEQALRETLVRFRPSDLEHIDHLAAAMELADQLAARVCAGEPVPCTGFLQQLLRFFGLLSDGELGVHHIRRYLEGVCPQDEQVRGLQLGVLKRLQKLACQIDGADDRFWRAVG